MVYMSSVPFAENDSRFLDLFENNRDSPLGILVSQADVGDQLTELVSHIILWKVVDHDRRKMHYNMPHFNLCWRSNTGCGYKLGKQGWIQDFVKGWGGGGSA